jgi:hypothetical protein
MLCATNDVSEAWVDDAWKDGVNLILKVGNVFRMETSALVHAVAIYDRVQAVQTQYVAQTADCIHYCCESCFADALPGVYQLGSCSRKS